MLKLPANTLVEQQLYQKIKQEGRISFAQYMQHCLYSEHGYYQNPEPILGQKGDFTTAPELSPLFGQCLARQIIQVSEYIKTPITIIEIGPGSGQLAKDILQYLEQQQIPIQSYCLLEQSASLKKIQQQKLKPFSHCQWIDQLPTTPIKGVIVANELFDALAVHYVQLNQEHQEWYVALKDDALTFELGPLSSPRLHQRIEDTLTSLQQPLPYPYNTEFNLEQDTFIKQCANTLDQGIMLTIDYGFGEKEYYHPSRDMGTLMTHAKHFASSDLLESPGMKDITAHVDFTALTRQAINHGFELGGYTTQGNTLLSLDILNLILENQHKQSSIEQVQQNAAVQTLISPSEMGELFKVIAYIKGIDSALKCFSHKDLSYLL